MLKKPTLQERYTNLYNQTIDLYFDLKRAYWNITQPERKELLRRATVSLFHLKNQVHRYLILEKKTPQQKKREKEASKLKRVIEN